MGTRQEFDRLGGKQEEPALKFPRASAIDVARELVKRLEPHCLRLVVAGSLRRGKSQVGDVELVYVPRPGPRDLLGIEHPESFILEAEFRVLLRDGTLAERRTAKGSAVWGPKNKLAVHGRTGIPVDLFATTEENWWNYLVCRPRSDKRTMPVAQTRHI